MAVPLKKRTDGVITGADWDHLATGFLGEGRDRWPASYVIYTDGTDTYAFNGITGIIDYGGPNDNGGVDGADGATVIQAAINALNTAGYGGNLLFKEGLYSPLTSGLTLYQKISLLGLSNRRAPKLEFDLDATTDCITLPTEAAYLAIEKMRITVKAGETTRDGIVFGDGTTFVSVRNVSIDGMGQDGISMDSAYSNRFYEITTNSNGNNGISIDETGVHGAGDNMFIGGYSRANTQDGIELKSSNFARTTFINMLFEVNGRYGGIFRGGPNLLENCNFEDNTDHGCYWVGWGAIIGGSFHEAPANKYGMYIQGGSRTRITGCSFSNNWKDIYVHDTDANYELEVGTLISAANITLGSRSIDHVWMGMNEFPAQATDANGRVALTFDFSFTNKPDVSVSLETNNAWYILSWTTNIDGNYDGCTIQVTNLAGVPVGAAVVVHAYVKRNG